MDSLAWNIGYNNSIMIRFKIAATIIFIFTVALFNTKRFKKINFNRISIYLILVILISILVSVQGSMIISILVSKIYINIQYHLNKNSFILFNVAFLFVFIIFYSNRKLFRGK